MITMNGHLQKLMDVKIFFKCSTHKCNGFGKLPRDPNKEKLFILTKAHNIPYIEHSYYKNNIIIKKYENNTISKEGNIF